MTHADRVVLEALVERGRARRHRLLEIEFPLLDQLQQQGRGDGFRERRDAVVRLRRRRDLRFQVGMPKSSGPDDFLVVDDGARQPGDPQRLTKLLELLLESLQPIRAALPRRSRHRGQQADQGDGSRTVNGKVAHVLDLATLHPSKGQAMHARRFLLAVALTFIAVASRPVATDVRDTRLLHQPATNGTHVAFVYADDLWVARLDGTDLRRLTTDDGLESRPAFSPDGKTIAFSAQYDGNTDVFIVPAEGGVPTRLTWHPGADLVQGFTTDGKRVLFSSPRAVFTTRYSQLFTVPLDGGMPDALPIPNADAGTYSPDGRTVAYSPIAPRFAQWKQYRGGTVSRVWLYNTANHDVEKVPQPADAIQRCRRDVDRRCRLLPIRSRRRVQPVCATTARRSASIGSPGTTTSRCSTPRRAAARSSTSRRATCTCSTPRTGPSRKLTFGVPSDLRETRPRFVSGPQWIRSASVRRRGARAVFEFRGEIVTVPAEKGDPRNLT